MRRTRWLILLAIAAILGGSVLLYRRDRRIAREHAPPKPELLGADMNRDALNYEAGQSTDGKTNFSIKARKYRQIRDTPNYELEDLELKLVQRDQQHYDLIKSAKASFNSDEGRMFSDGAVEITLDIPMQGKPTHQLTSVRTSGVTFDSKVGRANTDRHVEFTVENGDGSCTGASYDPSTHQLHLLHDAMMNLRGNGPHSKPMKIEAGEITYQESGSTVQLSPWSRMTRAETTINAAVSLVHLRPNHKIDAIDTDTAAGVDKYPTRELHYSADKLHVVYDDQGEVKTINAMGNAKMHEESQGAVTDTQSERADLDFGMQDKESVLRHVVASGKAKIVSKPAPDKAGHMAESRVLTAEAMEIHMRPEGKEIDRMWTRGPGTLELLANAPDEHHRILTGDQMNIGYGPKNAIKDYSSTNSTTLTFPAENPKVKNPQPSRTSSKTLMATFDGKGQLATMKQSENFVYEEGERHAKAASAFLDQQSNLMDLETGARIWDASGTTDADKIHMNQKTGDYTADGHVSTSRLPDEKPDDKKGGEMLDGDEPIQGTAPKMTSANHNKLVHYEGGAVLWQGGDRIEAQTIEIDRDKHQIVATGKVVTQILDERKDDSDDDTTPPKTAQMQGASVIRVSTSASATVSNTTSQATPPQGPVYTVVSSDRMIYTDADRLAHYEGDVVLNRPGLNVKTADMRAFLNPRDTDEDSRLNHAVGEGQVEITETSPVRQRIGRGEHGEYFTADDKIVLRGNLADLYDSIKKDDSHGTELTYFTTDDRLIVAGAPRKPVTSHLQRKNHAKPNANPGNR
jgi:lipopolysaccharide export system protein LptA